jgi:type I restriction-modification system DNA methylase subunit
VSETLNLSTSINRLADDLEIEPNKEIDSWVELHGLDRLENPLTIVSRQSVYNLILKSALYTTYKNEYDLEDLDSYENLSNAFMDAKRETSDGAFDEYILDDVLSKRVEKERKLILESARELVNKDEPAEVIGRVFERIVPQSSRRKLGQFRTPDDIARLMSEWVITEASDTVLDAGIGAGILSSYCYQVKKEISSNASLQQIYGVDRNQLAVVMATTALRIQNGGGRPNITYGDFFEYDQKELDSIISNPPYSRHHELSQEYKQKIKEQMEEIADQDLSSLSPLYSYFFIKSSQLVRKEGRIAFITPSEFLETNYGEGLKQFLLDNFHIQGIVQYDKQDSQFEEALTTSCITLLEKKESKEDDIVSFIKVDERIGSEKILSYVEGEDAGETDWGFVNKINQVEIEAQEKWSNFFNPISTVNTDELVPLSDIGNIKRGIATGDNGYFCLTQEEVDEWDIEKEYLSKLIRKGSHISGYKYNRDSWEDNRKEGREVWLLYKVDKWRGSFTGTNLQDYLDYGVESGANESYLASNREPWYVVDRRDPADILFTYMSREGVKFIYNETDARNLNNLHSIYIDDLNKKQTKALLAYLNSNIADEVVRRSGRTYSTGMEKVEPNELKQVPVLNPKNLENGQVETLARLFDELSSTKEEEKVLEEIDSVVDSCL